MQCIDKIKINKLSELFPLEFGAKGLICAYLYGSFASGEYRADSDIDIGIVLDDNVSQQTEFAFCLEERLEEIFSFKNFDVRVINQAPLEVSYQIIKDSKLIYCGSHDLRVDFETYVNNHYFDSKELIDRKYKNISNIIKERAYG